MSSPLLLSGDTYSGTIANKPNESIAYDLMSQGCTAPIEYDWMNYWKEPRILPLLHRPAISYKDILELERKIRGLVVALMIAHNGQAR